MNIILLDKNLFLAAISLHLYKAISEDRESIDEVAVMLTMAAMTTSLSGLSLNAPNTTVVRECPVGAVGDHGDDKKGRSYPTKS